jgi:hypothetical protein
MEVLEESALNTYASPAYIAMGATSTYAVLAGSTVTSAGVSRLTGDLGLYPGVSVTGFGPSTLTGIKNIGNTAADNAQGDLLIARLDAAARRSDETIPPAGGGLILGPGVYTTLAGLDITGTLTLDAQNRPDAAWIFQIASTLVLANDGKVQYINVAPGSTPKTWWNVGSSATLGIGATIVGTTMAYQSIAANTRATTGPLMANNAAVTLIDNTVNNF